MFVSMGTETAYFFDFGMQWITFAQDFYFRCFTVFTGFAAGFSKFLDSSPQRMLSHITDKKDGIASIMHLMPKMVKNPAGPAPTGSPSDPGTSSVATASVTP